MVVKIWDLITRALGLTHRGVKHIEDAFGTFDALIAKAEKGAALIKATKLANVTTRIAAAAEYRAVVDRTQAEDVTLEATAARGAALVKKLQEFSTV